MPARRLVVAITMLLVVVLSVGVVTAVGRLDTKKGAPTAEPTPSSSSPVLPTEQPTVEPTVQPTAAAPSATPTVAPTTPALPGDGGEPQMPNTGLPGAVPVVAAVLVGVALQVRRYVHHPAA